MQNLQEQVRSRVRCSLVIARGRFAREAKTPIEGDTRSALADWSGDDGTRYSEHYASDTGQSLGAVVYFAAGDDSRVVLGDLDRALAQRKLERIRTRISATT